VIVVVGNPVARELEDGPFAAAGLAAQVAIAAAEAGATAQLVGRVGEDPAGESSLLDLARHGVGHAAMLRDPTRPTLTLPAPTDGDGVVHVADPASGTMSSPSTLEAADLKLAFDYLPEYAVIVVAEQLVPAALAVAVAAATWSGSALIVIGLQEDLAGLPEDATVFEPPDDGDPDGAFGAMVGAYAAGLDRGDDAKAAFAAASAAVGSTSAEQTV
jgi:hypothetical protein